MSETIWDREFDEHESMEEGWMDESENDLTPVTPEVKSLLNLGQLRDTFTIRGHSVTLRTLTIDEELEVGLLIKKYDGTDEWGRALATGLLAASIETVDDRPLVHMIGPEENVIQKKFDFVRKRMYWPVIKALYEEAYIPLVQKQVNALDELIKK